MFRIFLSVLRDGFMASVTSRPRLIQIRLPCAKRLGDVLRVLLLKEARKVLALNLFSETFCELIWCYRKRFPEHCRPFQCQSMDHHNQFHTSANLWQYRDIGEIALHPEIYPMPV